MRQGPPAAAGSSKPEAGSRASMILVASLNSMRRKSLALRRPRAAVEELAGRSVHRPRPLDEDEVLHVAALAAAVEELDVDGADDFRLGRAVERRLAQSGGDPDLVGGDVDGVLVALQQ